MQFTITVQRKLVNVLATLLIGFLVFQPMGPVVFISADDGDNPDDGPPVSQEQIDQILSDPSGFMDDVLANPQNYITQDDDDDEDTDDDANDNGENSDNGNADDADNPSDDDTNGTDGDNSDDDNRTADPVLAERIGSDPSAFMKDVLANPQNYVTQDDDDDEDPADTDDDANDNDDDGTPGPNVNPGPQDDTTGSSDDTASNDDDNSDNTGTSGSGYVYDRPQVQLPGGVGDLLNNIPTTLEEAIRYRENHYDEQSVTTQDANAFGETETTQSDEPTASAQNNTDDVDDSVVSSGSSNTTEGEVTNEQNLEQENVTTGQAVSGDNALESDKDVLNGTINTGDTDITSQSEVSGNNSNVSTGGSGGGGSSGWIQKLWGNAEKNTNDTDDSVVSADAQAVKELTILNKNKAFVSNVKELLSKSGGNRLSGVGRVDESGIFTGAARAKSSLLNIINTNTVDSAFLPLTIDLFDSYSGNINILDILFDAFGRGLDGSGAVTATGANNTNDTDDSVVNASGSAFESVGVFNENDGYIYNDLDIKAISGQNQALAGRKLKETTIRTGRVDVANNLVNFLNTNLTQSKIGVVVINVFADWAGNLIIPGAGKLAANVSNPTGVIAGSTTNSTGSDDSINSALALANTDLEITSIDHGGVETDINVFANSGNNYTSFDKDSENINIKTGETQTRSNVLTLANRNIIGAAFSQGFFNILGNWNGAVVGTPDDAMVYGEGNSFIVASEGSALTGAPGATATTQNNENDTDDSITNTQAEVNRSVTVNNQNVGRVANRLNITGDSGSNSAASYKGQDVTIDTGDVGVANNVANFVNNNFSFSKGLVVALNVFGDWRGNVAYDEFKDLSSSVAPLSNDTMYPGSVVDYEVSAFNSGTEPTDAGTLTFSYDSSRFDLVDADGGAASGNTITWPFPALESGDTFAKQVGLQIHSDLPIGNHIIETSAHVTQDDTNPANNTSVSQLQVPVKAPAGSNDSTTRDRSDFGVAVGDTTDTTQNNNSGGSNSTNNNSDQTGNEPVGNNTNNNNTNNSDNTSDSSDSTSGSGVGTPVNNNTSFSHTPGYLIVKKENGGYGPYLPGDKIAYVVTVQNPGDTRIDGVIVYDSLSSGDILAEVSWPIDYVDRGETVKLEYEMTVQADAPSGTYTNAAYASGFDAANATIKSNIASTEVAITNPNMPETSGAIASSGTPAGTITDEAAATEKPAAEIGGVIDTFNTETEEVESVNTPLTPTAGSTGSIRRLSADEEKNLETTVESEIRDTSAISRYIPVAQAAEGRVSVAAREDDTDTAATSQGSTQNGSVLGTSDTTDKLAYAVYPNFLHFDGMDAKQPASDSNGFFNWFTSQWIVWILLLLAFVIGYLSYREKQKQKQRALW